MRIAVTYENGEIFQHFGHTSQFKIYNVEDGKITTQSVVDTDGKGHGALANFLKELGVDILICGGIGSGAQTALADAGVLLFGGVKGSCDDAANAYIAGSLEYNPSVKCNHHSEGHTCGGHHHGNGESCESHRHNCGGKE